MITLINQEIKPLVKVTEIDLLRQYYDYPEYWGGCECDSSDPQVKYWKQGVGLCMLNSEGVGYWWYYETDTSTNPITDPYLIPSYLEDSFDISIDEVNFEPVSGNPIINFKIDYNFSFYSLVTYMVEKQIYSDLKVDITTNGVSESYDSSFTQRGDHEIISYQPDINAFDENLNIDIKLSSSKGYYEEYTFNLLTDRQNDFVINMEDGKEVTHILPIGDLSNPLGYEYFTFNPLNVISDYPIEISEILNFSYSNDVDSVIPNLNFPQDAYIDLNGIEDNYHEVFFDPLSSNFVFAENYSYDEEIKNTIKDISSTSSFIFPWDYSNNMGYINIPLTIETYEDINFSLITSLGTSYSLRGDENSKYKFVDYQYIEKDWSHKLTIKNIKDTQITEEFIKDNYEQKS